MRITNYVLLLSKPTLLSVSIPLIRSLICLGLLIAILSTQDTARASLPTMVVVLSDQTTCEQISGIWDTPNNCIIEGGFTIDAGQTLEINGVRLLIGGTVNNEGVIDSASDASISVLPEGIFNNNGGTINGGIGIEESAAININGGVINGGMINGENGRITNNGGTINDGIQHDRDAITTNNTGATINGEIFFVEDRGSLINHGIIASKYISLGAETTSIRNDGTITINGSLSISDFCLLDNEGVVTINEGSETSTSGEIRNRTGGIIINNGPIGIFGEFNGKISNDGIFTNTATGSINTFSDAPVRNSGTINNQGRITIRSGSIFDNSGILNNEGTTTNETGGAFTNISGTIFNTCDGELVGMIPTSGNPVDQEEPCPPIGGSLLLAVNDNYTVAGNSHATVLIPAVTANDDFGENGPGTMDIETVFETRNAIVAVNDGGTPGDPRDDTINYTPDIGFSGTDSFDYSITDSTGATSTATVTVTVLPMLVDNPSFVTDAEGWSGYGGATIRRIVDCEGGTLILDVNGPASLTKFGINDTPNWVASTPAVGTRYRFSAWVKSDTNVGSAQLRVREYKDGLKIGATTLSAGVELSPTWQLVTIQHVAQAAGSTLDFQVLNDPVARGEVFQVDEIAILAIENLVDNPSFEADTKGWSGYSGGTVQRVMDGLDGDFSLETTGPASLKEFGVNDSPNWVASTQPSGTRYRFSAWVKSGTSSGTVRLRVREYKDGVKVGTTTLSDGAILSSTWQQITVDHVVQSAGSTLDLQVLDDPVAPGEVFQVDDISIIPNPFGEVDDISTLLEPDFAINENLVDNPCFEANTEGWNAYSGATIQRVTDGVAGDFSLEVTGPASITTFGVNDSPNWVASTTAARTEYLFSAWVKSSTSSGGAWLRVREFKDGIKVDRTTKSRRVTLSPTWQQITVDHFVRATGSTLDLQVLNDPMTPGEAFQVDGISVVVVPCNQTELGRLCH